MRQSVNSLKSDGPDEAIAAQTKVLNPLLESTKKATQKLMQVSETQHGRAAKSDR
tara:strand:+ start:6559 stop:6723 length:165 start_codon:yes stop_codon:yes gene_type:complete